MAYAAGDGITIVGRTISAEVARADLDATAKVAEAASNTASGASTAVSPAGTYGGTWERLPSLGAFKWERTA